MFSDVVLNDLARKMFDDMKDAGERTMMLVPFEQKAEVLVACIAHMTILASVMMAERHHVDERTARLALYRHVIKNLNQGGRDGRQQHR